TRKSQLQKVVAGGGYLDVSQFIKVKPYAAPHRGWWRSQTGGNSQRLIAVSVQTVVNLAACQRLPICASFQLLRQVHAGTNPILLVVRQKQAIEYRVQVLRRKPCQQEPQIHYPLVGKFIVDQQPLRTPQEPAYPLIVDQFAGQVSQSATHFIEQIESLQS